MTHGAKRIVGRERDFQVDTLRSLLDYDPETGKLRWKYRPNAVRVWNTRYAGTVAGCFCNGEIRISIDGIRLSAARVIVYMSTGQPLEEGKRVMFLDGDATNLKLSNLKPVDDRTVRRNYMHPKRGKHTLSSGISKSCRKYVVRDRTGGGHKYLSFSTLEEAIDARERLDSELGYWSLRKAVR